MNKDVQEIKFLKSGRGPGLDQIINMIIKNVSKKTKVFNDNIQINYLNGNLSTKMQTGIILIPKSDKNLMNLHVQTN